MFDEDDENKKITADDDEFKFRIEMDTKRVFTNNFDYFEKTFFLKKNIFEVIDGEKPVKLHF